jgi:TolB-like protein/tetratricopeptide (TPR) repeat protein
MATIHKFGPFRLDADAEILFRGAEPTVLGQRAVALLRLLLERAGAPVSKDALIEAAWPGLAIEDSNLTVQIAALRRVFEEVTGGASWIETLPRRGYRYVGPLVATDNPPAEANPQPSPALTLPDRPSVAVLPFSNLSGDPEPEYFADGMVEDIVAGLSRIKWLFVVARSSSFAYKGKAVDAKRVGRELGVRYLLQGSLRKDGNRVRIAAQMIEAETGGHVWAERYDRPLDDIFVLQDEITLSVIGAIEPSLRRAEVERVKRKRPDSLDAYDLVLRAQPDVYSGMPDRVTKALVLLERALALDPTYALAHAFAAMCHHCLFLRAGLHQENRAASIRYAHAAIVHGQDDALALTFAGFSIGMDGHDHAAAFAAFEAALAVSPSSALTYILGSVILGWSGEAERAIEWGERGMRLSPFDPWAFAAFHSLILGHFHCGRYEEATNAAHKAVQSNPGHSISYMLLAAPLAKLGRLEESKAAAARVLELQPAFRYSRQFSGVDCAPALAASLSEALRATGLPE